MVNQTMNTGRGAYVMLVRYDVSLGRVMGIHSSS
jgi:hypothetical protein